MKSYWKELLLLIVGATAVVVWALPTILGSKWVYQPLVDRLAEERFRLSIDKVELGWFRPISFQNIRLDTHSPTQASGDAIGLAKIDSIRSDRGLFGFLWHLRNLGTVEIINPNLDIQLLEDGSNLQRLISAIEDKRPSEDADPPDPATSAQAPPSLDAVIVVRGLHVTVKDQNGQQPLMVVPPFDATVAYKSLEVESQIVVEPTQALDRVIITQELVRLGLSRAVPLLAKSTEFDGQVSLESGQIVIPIQRPYEAVGSARLTLHQVRSVPTDPAILGAIDLLGRLFKKEMPHELIFVDGSTIQVEMSQGLVKHTGVRAGLPRVDQRLQIATSGTVSLVDRRLNLSLELPVPVEQLARRQSVKQLGVPSITLPIRGTIDNPELDFKALRQDSASLLAAMSGALSEEAPLAGAVVGTLGDVADGDADQMIEAGAELLQQIIQNRQQRQRLNDQPQTDSDSDAEPARPGPLRESLRNLLRGNRSNYSQ